MTLKKKSVFKTVCPALDGLGYYFLKAIVPEIPIVFAKKVPGAFYLFLLIGRNVSTNGGFSIEISLSPSMNVGLTGRDIPVGSIRPLEDIIDVEKEFPFEKDCDRVFWTIDMIQNYSLFANHVALAESRMLRDYEMIEAVRLSKKLYLAVYLEEWVVSWYHEKEESQLPTKFLRYTPKEAVDDIPLKWFIVAESVLSAAWLYKDKKSVRSLAIQSYYKDYLDYLPLSGSDLGGSLECGGKHGGATCI